MSSELNLTVQVPADEWAYAQRRLTYLETLLVRIVRDLRDPQEWFTAAELAALGLPGLPASRAGIAGRAKAARWPFRRLGRHVVYHVTSLPTRAFDDLIARILDLPVYDIEVPDVSPAAGAAARAAPATIVGNDPENTAPAWVLPLMRLIRGEANGSLAKAWRALPDHLPSGTVLPDVNQAATVLVNLGLGNRIAR